ncbi:MAG: hypothetical protein ABJC10_02425 [Acidobacteriota bacterium]
MRQIQISLLLCVAIFATGCPKYRPSVDFKNPNSLVAKINEHIKAQNTLYVAALGSSPAQAKQIRNELIEDALPYIDGAYIDFITDIQAGRDRNNFVLDLVELGAAASVGITKGERSLQIIGVALTAFRGGRRSLDANFYKDQSTPILISKMDGNRAKVRTTILEREKKEPIDYPLGAAVSDLVDYYNAGTLVRAFTQLQQDTALITKQSEDDVLVLKGVPLTRAATVQDVTDVRTTLAVLRTLKTSLDSGDADEIKAATTKLQNIFKALEADPDTKRLVQVGPVTSAEPNGQNLLQGLRVIFRNIATDDPVHSKIDKAIVTNGR